MPATVKIAKTKSPGGGKAGGAKSPRKPEKRPPAIAPIAAGKGGHNGAKSPSRRQLPTSPSSDANDRERKGKEVDEEQSPSFMKQMRVHGIGRRASAVVPEEIIIPPAARFEDEGEGGGGEEEQDQPGSPTNYKHKSR